MVITQDELNNAIDIVSATIKGWFGNEGEKDCLLLERGEQDMQSANYLEVRDDVEYHVRRSFEASQPVTLLVKQETLELEVHLEDILDQFIEGMVEVVADDLRPDAPGDYVEIVKLSAEVGDWEYYGCGYFIRFTPLWVGFVNAEEN